MVNRARDHTYTNNERNRSSSSRSTFETKSLLKGRLAFQFCHTQESDEDKIKPDWSAAEQHTILCVCVRSMFGCMLSVVGDNHLKQSPTSTPSCSEMSVHTTLSPPFPSVRHRHGAAKKHTVTYPLHIVFDLKQCKK